MNFEEAKALVLENKIVEVKPIIRKKPFYKEGHDGEFMFTGCAKTYMLPYVMNKRAYKNIFEDSNEQTAFEVLMDKKPGSLNVYSRDNNFWAKEYKVEITKEGKTLDLSIPSHALEYRVLKANSHKITTDWSHRGNPAYEFCLIDETQAEEDNYKLAEKKEDAMELFMKLRKSNAKMYNLLRVMGLKPTKESKSNGQWLKAEIQRIMDQIEKPKGGGLYIDDFIKAAQDPRFELKVLIYDAMDIKEIVIKSGHYKLASNDEYLGKTLNEVADWLSDIKNQEHKLLIEQRLQINK